MTQKGNKEVGEADPRQRLAGERTLLAWMRTGVAMMGFGFVAARFGYFFESSRRQDARSRPRPSACRFG